jgi:hypothetical protein
MRIKCKKVELFKQETKLKKMHLQMELLHCLETNLNTQRKQKIVNILLEQANRAYGTEISPRLFVISFVILLYAISYNI